MNIAFTPKKVCKTPHSFSVVVSFEDYNGDQNTSLEIGLFNNKGKSIKPNTPDLTELLTILESIVKTDSLALVHQHNLPWHCNESEEYMNLYEYEIFYTDAEFRTYPVVLA